MNEIKKKIVLAGHFGVGKTSLIKRFVHSIFSEEYLSTIGVAIDKKTLEIDNHLIHLIIWDIAGEKDQDKINPMHLMGTHGFIYVCDLSRPSTYEDLDNQVQKIKTVTGNVPVLKVGNKTDLISNTELEHLQKNLSLDLYSSAKKDEGVEFLFEEIAAKFV
jgi:small GTP-binding protein